MDGVLIVGNTTGNIFLDVLEMAPTMDYRRRLPGILSWVFAGGNL